MKTILFIWELGSAFGHAAPLAALARAVKRLCADRDMACKVVFAFRDPVLGRRIAGEEGGAILPVPHLQHLVPLEHHSGSYADLLIIHGFGKQDELSLALAAWDDLFALVQPDLIVADHSPTAVLAAAGTIPTVVTGNGFTVPPSEPRDFPSLRGNLPPSAAQSRLLQVVNQVQAARGRARFEHLPQVLKGDRRAIFTLPHIDPYEGLRRDRLFGPYQPGLDPTPLPDTPTLFYYGQSGHRDVDDITWALIETAVPKICVYSGPVSVAGKVLQDSGAEVHFEPPVLADTLARASLVISHGGSGLGQAALKMGRPQLILPIHFESALTAAKLQATGSAMVVEDGEPERKRAAVKDTLSQAIQSALNTTSLASNAQKVAAQIAQADLPADPALEAARTCLELLD